MWKIGDRVFGRKGIEPNWYTGTVRHIDGDRCYVIFDDGDDALLEAAKLKKLDLNPDDRIFARMPMELEFRPAKVVAWDDDKVRVQWANGEEDWTSFGMIRLEPEAKPKPAVREHRWREGDRVFACWHDLFWYPGVIIGPNGAQFHVLLDDGNQGFVSGDRLKPLALDAGEHVFCRWKGGPEFFPAEVTRCEGSEVIHVTYDDGDEETTSIRLLRVQRDEWFPPTEVDNLHEGDRIFACWFDGHWYPGVVLALDGKRVHILFDDGDQAQLTPDKVRPLEIKVGDHVFCRFKGGPAYYPGEVTKKRGEVLHIHYDDGEDETTSVRLVRLQIDSSADVEQRFS
jgi:hypothetical protein